MYRFAEDHLKKWKTRSNRKPLVIRGARQVGKTHLVRTFAESAFDNIIEINLDQDSDASSCFDKAEPKDIIQLLEVKYGESIIPGSTLLFIDEIQVAPELLAKLRYFYEKLPELHLIAAGSLLDFALEQHEFSMPVGRIEYLFLGPMTFFEFLLATENKKSYEFLSNYKTGELIPETLHKKFNDFVKAYIVVGGMPESIHLYAQSKSFRECDMAKQTILATYKDDFSNYGKKVNLQTLLTVFHALPRVVGQKLKYVNISRDIRSADLQKALHLLTLARVCYPIHHTACNGIPLGAEVNPRILKPIFLDVGLLLTACGLTMADIVEANDLMLVNSGQVCEQFVGQHLLYQQEPYIEPQLFYWLREKATSNAKVDYVISRGEKIIPVEVKAGKTGSLRSLHQFSIEKQINTAVRLCTAPPFVVEAEGKMPNGDSYKYRVVSLPFYLVERVSGLITAEF